MIVLMVMLGLSTVVLGELDPSNLLLYYKNRTKVPDILTTTNGAPVCYNYARSTLNTNLMNNDHYNQRQAHLHRERIPERLVHAKGNGAFGYFEVTKNVSHICEADFLSEIGKRTPVVVRFSQATGERGLTELNPDLRSLAIKFYTLAGNFDIPGFNTPTFFSNEALSFHTFVHAIRRDPSTNLFNPNALWDAMYKYPEAVYTFMLVLWNRGIPDGYHHMPGFGVHTYQLHNATGHRFYVKFHFIPNAGIKGLNATEAAAITDLDYMTRSLYKNIQNGNYPSWTMSVQVLTEEQAISLGSDAADVSKIFSLDDYPLQEVGQIVLNRNPKNFHVDLEQLAFCPGNLVKGIDGGLGKVFEARRVGYKDAHYYRLGANVDRIAVNYPFRTKVHTYDRDGVPPVANNEGDAPNYDPNSFNGAVPVNCDYNTDLLQVVETKANNTEQTTKFYNEELDDNGRSLLVENLITNLKQVTITSVLNRAIQLLCNISTDLGSRVAEGVNATVTC